VNERLLRKLFSVINVQGKAQLLRFRVSIRQHHVFCLIVGLHLVSFSAVQEPELLDLTNKKPEAETERIAPGSGGLIGGSGTKPVELPLKIELERLDKQQYGMGERFVYELSITNIGKQTLAIPWEPDREKALQASAELSVISLHLIIDELGNDAIFGAERIFASQTAPDTYKNLPPGGRVKIRAPGFWYPGNEELAGKVFRTLPRRFAIKARVRLGSYPTDTLMYEPAYSNILSVELRKQ
jgi:hypothetical protein